MKKFLITGITGQDGLFLTKYIFNENLNFKIVGISRNKNNDKFYKNLNYLGLSDLKNINLLNLDLENFKQVNDLIKNYKPDYIYNLTGPSSPYESIKFPKKYFSIENIFNNIFNSVYQQNLHTKLFQASSSEMFASKNTGVLDENDLFNPKTQYAISKYKVHQKIVEFNENVNFKMFSGIMFNHESEFRKDKYLIMKIINSAINISRQNQKKLTLGSLEYTRDWTYAEDIASAIYSINLNGSKNSYVIGTGRGYSIKDMVSCVFSSLNLNYEKYIDVDSSLLRKGDPEKIISNPKKIKNELNWNPEYSFEEMIEKCLVYKLNN